MRESWQQTGALVALAVLVSVFFIYYVFTPHRKSKLMLNVPVLGVDSKGGMDRAKQYFVNNACHMLEEGYRKTGGGFYYVPAPDCMRLMIPTRYIEELKNAPDEQADFLESFIQMFEGNYTTIGKRWDLHPRVVKRALNPSLSTVLPVVEEEIALAFKDILPACEGWTAVPIADVVKKIVAQASSRMIGGKALSRSPEWLNTSINFTTDAWLAAQRLKKFPSWTRPLLQWILPEMTNLKYHIRVAKNFIQPILIERMNAGYETNGESKPIDLLQMLYDNAHGRDKDLDFLSYTGLVVSFAAIHTTASVPAHLIYDLCARPEYIKILREEVEQVVQSEGTWTKASLAKLSKMDSFMKESQRFNPLVFMTFGRVIHSDYTLKDGTVLPAGTVVGVPSHAIANDPRSCHDPDRFDGLRWLPSQSSSEDSTALPTFVTTNAKNLAWGYGKHACSGRFFASYEIKMIMAYILRNYDMKFEGNGIERPGNISFELQNAPDPNVRILLRKRGN